MISTHFLDDPAFLQGSIGRGGLVCQGKRARSRPGFLLSTSEHRIFDEYNGGSFSVDLLSPFNCLFNCIGWFKPEVVYQ